ncbi:hypothetical protein [Caldisphaera lagunensis]|uniref:hypothetical protein n=1 Tax=Caldisphaera lagunensis TaxID=200415 RepID=UPI000662BA2E|nr:hypothetical protein [Caldisphaera lagunensis]
MNHMSNEGKILIVCKNCQTILYRYVIGDKNDKNKFNGPPIPKKALSGFDRLTCPVCGEPLNLKPKSIRFFSFQMFNKLYEENGYKLIDKTKGSILNNMKGITQSSLSNEASVDDKE